MYRISSNKRPGAYFLQGLRDPAFKQDRAFIQGPVLISYCLFSITYFGGTVDLRHSLIAVHLRGMWALPTEDLHPRQRWPFVCALRKLPAKWQGFSAIWCSKRQSLDERQREFAWQIDRSTNNRLLDAKFAFKLHVRAVREARPIGTPAFIWSPATISYWAVKPPAFKRGLAFT